MEQLRLIGCKFSLDDFGTGYSSLFYLKQLPFDHLKIDRSFVHDIAVNKKSKAIARSIVSLGRDLGLTVIAEGVETEQQRDCLLRIGCREFQGFLFSRPVPLSELEQIVCGQTSSSANDDGTPRETRFFLHPSEPMPVVHNHCASPSEDCYFGSAVGR
jgi:EAL domain-containing protein (putative c-di-GMP-specific phosphodiesterase class I)